MICFWLQLSLKSFSNFIIMCSYADSHTSPHPNPNLDDLRVNKCLGRGPAMDYISTDLSVDSSSHFPFRVWTNRKTEITTLFAATTASIGN